MLTLYIGSKNYSSWSLRPWIALAHYGIPFKEVMLPLFVDGSEAERRKFSPTGKVPALADDDLRLWDSLAILEYLAETYPQHRLWPEDPATRALARAVSAEMHSGFVALRTHMPMNIVGRYPECGRQTDVDADITRIESLWTELRVRFGAEGPFLFGHFTIADAMFLPVATRFRTYGVTLREPARQYAQHLLNLPAFGHWQAAAAGEKRFYHNEPYSSGAPDA